MSLVPGSLRDQPKRGGKVDVPRLNVIKRLADEHRNHTIFLPVWPRRRVRHVANVRRILIHLFVTCKEPEILSGSRPRQLKDQYRYLAAAIVVVVGRRWWCLVGAS